MSKENKQADLPEHRDKRFDAVRDTWYWKLSKPVRVVVHFVIRTRNAYIHYGGIKGMYKRWKQKKGEAAKRVDFGTKELSECRRAPERRRDCISKRDQDQRAGTSLQYPGKIPAGDDRVRAGTDL